MAADLVPAAGPGVVERVGDRAALVVAACERARALLRQALEAGEIERIAEVRSQAEAVRVYTRQKQLGRDAELAAAEIVRRAERGIGVAIRRAQQQGQIARRGDRGGRGAPGVYGGNPGDTRGDHLGSASPFFKHPERARRCLRDGRRRHRRRVRGRAGGGAGGGESVAGERGPQDRPARRPAAWPR